ncbi:MAG: ComEC/Rec2 family competence protein [Oleiphilaceae bacterium]|nr:ComEC/Rec2 family competence protein [Oleiphilaceae bacterium]
MLLRACPGAPALPWGGLALAMVLLALVTASLSHRTESLSSPLPEGERTLTGYPCNLAQWRDGRGLVLRFCVLRGLESAGSRPRVLLELGEDGPRTLPSGLYRLKAHLHPLRVPANPGERLGEAYYLREGLVARARVRHWQPLPEAHCGVHCRYHAWRAGLVERLRRHLPAMMEPGLVEGLTLGSRAALEPRHWQVLEATGTNHLLAISGLHLGLIALFLAALCRWCLTRFAGEGGPGRAWWLAALVMTGSTVYALVAGFNLPIQRALVMLAVVTVAMASGRRIRATDAWLIALVLVLLSDPLAPLSMGFWLSFAAVVCLVTGFANRLEPPPAWQSLLLAQWLVILGLWPFLLVFERSATSLALLVNLAAIPLMSLVIMPLVLLSLPLVLASPVSAAWVEPGLSLLLDTLWRCLQWLSGFSVVLPSLPLKVTVLLALTALLASFPVSSLWRWVSLLMLCTWLILWPWQPQKEPVAPETPELVFLDVPGVTAVLIRAGERTGLYYQDQRSYPQPLPVPRPLLKALRTGSVQALDLLVIPHGREGAQAVWGSAGLPVRRLVAGAGTGAAPGCPSGETLRWPALTLRFWQDAREGLTVAERSCVLYLETGVGESRQSVLLPGGIGRSGERRLLQWLPGFGPVTGLLAPAGGRAGSSQPGWVSTLRPQWVLFDRPPSPRVRSRYRDQGSRWWYPGWHGAVTLSPGQGEIQALREGAPFWWRRPPD